MIKLGSICEFINGGAWSDKEYVSQGIPVLKVSNCKSSGFLIDDVDYLPMSAAEKYAKNKLQKDDVIIATVGSHPNLEDSAAGRSYIVNSLVEGYYLNQNAVCIRTLNEAVLSQRYLGYLTKYYPFQHFIQMRGRGAANQMRIAISSIKEYTFDLPNVEIQCRIADILSAYDNLIENNQKQIKLLEEAARRLYKEWFVDLRFPDYEATPVVDGVPEGWTLQKIADVCETVGGGTPSTKIKEYYQDGNIPWVTPTDITKSHSLILLDTATKITAEGLSHSSAKMVPAGTILMTSRASIGFFALCEYAVCTNQGFIACIPHQPDMQLYLLYNLLSRVEEIRGKASGSTYLEISKKVFRDFDIIVPSSLVLQKFQAAIYILIQQMLVLIKQTAQLQEARDRLLLELMSGEVEV